ncbi:MAG: hypothetical protein H0V44_11795 [Planctomycetes bacterium]|nr:hypothetical protein [Planctomycetota bacterium]
MARFLVIGSVTALAMLVQPGCISHVARVAPSPDPIEVDHPSHVVVGATLTDPAATTVLRSPLPIDAVYTAWKRDESGALMRCDGRVRTPLRWWQRFPMDVVADMLPVDFEATADSQISYRLVPVRDEAEILQHAQRDGFAHAPAAHQ